MARLRWLAFRLAPEGSCLDRGLGTGRGFPQEPAGRGLSPGDGRRTRSFRHAEARRANGEAALRAGGIRPGAEPVSRGLGRREGLSAVRTDPGWTPPPGPP